MPMAMGFGLGMNLWKTCRGVVENLWKSRPLFHIRDNHRIFPQPFHNLIPRGFHKLFHRLSQLLFELRDRGLERGVLF